MSQNKPDRLFETILRQQKIGAGRGHRASGFGIVDDRGS
jgi:hypothetical protein